QGFANIEFVLGDVYNSGLRAGSFDLVHTRFVASTAGNPERLLQESIQLTRPGGNVAFQEADMLTLNCYPAHPAWERLKSAFTEVFPYISGNAWSAYDLYRMLRQTGLEGVQYRAFLVGFRSSDRMADYLPATIESVRSEVIKRHLMISNDLDAALAESRAHLADPDTVCTYLTVVQVWGTRPPLNEQRVRRRTRLLGTLPAHSGGRNAADGKLARASQKRLLWAARMFMTLRIISAADVA